MSTLDVLRTITLMAALAGLSAGCAGPEPAADAAVDRGDASASATDAGATDAGATDAGATDAGATDAGTDPLADVIDAIMEPAIDAGARDDLDRCVGAVTVVVTADRALVRGYGATEAGGSARPDGDTLFQVGSLTKLFTGLALARLVAEGELSAADPVGTHVGPDLQPPLAGTLPTMGELVSHHAGLPDYPTNMVDRDLDGARDPGISPLSPAAGYSRTDLRTFLDGWSPVPAAGYEYSNVGLGLLGLALQDHLGATGYHAVLRRLVLDDLGMTSTWGEIAAVDAGALSRVAQGYAVMGTRRAPGSLASMGVLAGGGEIVTTGNDLARFLEAVTGARATALDPAVALAIAPIATGPSATVDLGYAVEIEHRADGDVFSKPGATASYTAHLVFRREPQVGVAVVVSCGGFRTVKDLALEIHDGVVALER